MDGKDTPPKYLNPDDALHGIVNPAYLQYEQQDQFLVAWLLASMDTSVLTQMVGLTTGSQIWNKLHVCHASQSRAKVKSLQIQLRTPKRDRNAATYLLDMKKIVDALTVIGSLISTEDHVEAILDGLYEDYDNFVTSILTRSDPYTIEEIQALLLSQEELHEKYKTAILLLSTTLSSQVPTTPIETKVLNPTSETTNLETKTTLLSRIYVSTTPILLQVLGSNRNCNVNFATSLIILLRIVGTGLNMIFNIPFLLTNLNFVPLKFMMILLQFWEHPPLSMILFDIWIVEPHTTWLMTLIILQLDVPPLELTG